MPFCLTLTHTHTHTHTQSHTITRNAFQRPLTSTSLVRTTIKKPRVSAGVRPKGARQATKGLVYIYDVNAKCDCVRGCHNHFKGPEGESAIEEARKPLYDANMDRPTMRAILKENWKKHLLLPDNTPCCLTMATEIFACSRALLFPDSRPKQSRSEASSESPKAAGVCSWFFSLRRELDVMPDGGGWYMVNQPKRRYVYEDYAEDAADWPELYPFVQQSYFNYLWRTLFNEIRLRKHCRFTKCPFCVTQREVSQDRNLSPETRQEAKRKLRLHLSWAHKRERGLYMEKIAKARKEPSKYISIAIDGTDKFPNGFPHFFEVTKETDGVRLKVHIIVVMVHGSRPRVYLGWESLKSDPNLVCECLFRTLRAEEFLRGKLPDTLYLQVDNCWRENKNTYTEKFLEWISERKVFSQIFASFLPKGHTHFDCDQFASRITEATKFINITSMDQLTKLIEDCYSPAPVVDYSRCPRLAQAAQPRGKE